MLRRLFGFAAKEFRTNKKGTTRALKGLSLWFNKNTVLLQEPAERLAFTKAVVFFMFVPRFSSKDRGNFSHKAVKKNISC